MPPVFEVIRRAGRVEDGEMRRVFNMGIGCIAVAAPERAGELERRLRDAGEDSYRIGEIESGEGGVHYA